MKKQESKIQAECYKWFNNNFCLKHHKPRMMMYSNANESMAVFKKILKQVKIPSKVIEKIMMRAYGMAKAMGLTAGVADTTILLPNTLIYIEFKTPTGRQSPKQKDFEERVKSLGFQYHIIRSVEEFKRLFSNI